VANLVWESPANTNNQEEYERFATFILARTGLSLRELNLSEAAPQEVGAMQPPAHNHPAQMIFLTLSRAIERARRTRRANARNAWLAIMLGSLLFIGGPWGAQTVQMKVYEDLIASVTSRTPLYQASLSQPSSDWPALEVDSTGRARTFYQDGMFYLTGSSRANKPRIVLAHIPNDYRDAAVAVTVKQLANSPSGGVGLLLRYTLTPERFIGFYFTSEGYWALESFDSPAPTGHRATILITRSFSASSVNMGADMSNTLLVIMRGDEYACYINRRFVGKAFDSLIESGSPGVVNYDNSTVAAFSNFAIYPV
jgi:hypothetical protein